MSTPNRRTTQFVAPEPHHRTPSNRPVSGRAEGGDVHAYPSVCAGVADTPGGHAAGYRVVGIGTSAGIIPGRVCNAHRSDRQALRCHTSETASIADAAVPASARTWFHAVHRRENVHQIDAPSPPAGSTAMDASGQGEDDPVEPEGGDGPAHGDPTGVASRVDGVGELRGELLAVTALLKTSDARAGGAEHRGAADDRRREQHAEHHAPPRRSTSSPGARCGR